MIDDKKRLCALYQKNLRYQIWNGSDQLLVNSANTPLAPLTAVDGFSESRDQALRSWRFFAIWDRRHTYRSIAAEPHNVCQRLILDIAYNIFAPLLIGLPLLLLLLWLAIRQAMRPLNRLTAEIALRRPSSLVPLGEQNNTVGMCG